MRQDSADIKLNFDSGDQTNLMSFEDKQSMVGFFALLLKIDKRINPKTYEDNGSSANPN